MPFDGVLDLKGLLSWQAQEILDPCAGSVAVRASEYILGTLDLAGFKVDARRFRFRERCQQENLRLSHFGGSLANCRRLVVLWAAISCRSVTKWSSGLDSEFSLL